MRKFLLVSALVVFLDQTTKILAEYYFKLGESLNVMPYFDLTLVYNYGAAFGFLADQGGWQRWFFMIIAIIITIFLFRWLLSLRYSQKLTALSLSLILGGAIGNIIDRIYYGYVIDFLDFYVGNYHWPAFNLADSAVVCGAIIMAFDTILNQNQSSKKS